MVGTGPKPLAKVYEKLCNFKYFYEKSEIKIIVLDNKFFNKIFIKLNYNDIKIILGNFIKIYVVLICKLENL